MSRINVKLKSDQESEINGMGPEIQKEDVEKLFQKLSFLKEGDVLVLSGSIPAAVGEDVYERILGQLEGKKVLAVVDAEKDLLLGVLKYHPFLIKPNNHELGQIFGKELKGEDEIIDHARKLREFGAVNVLVSMAGAGAILVDENDQVYHQKPAKGTVKNSVGAGDSMVAGFVAGYLETGDYGYALRLGTACGGATAFSEGIGTKDDIMKLFYTL